MNVSIRSFIFHKNSEKYEDCYDRYSVNLQNHKFAVSDGVSKSFFPGIWAQLLVDTFVNHSGNIDIKDAAFYQTIQKKWIDQVSEIVHKPDQKYYVKNFFIQEKPAAATFVGLRLFHNEGIPCWDAYALGDSFLFFVPDGVENIGKELKEIIYVSSKKNFEFDNFPDFFDSRRQSNKGKIKYRQGNLQNGTFYLVSDALAEWFITYPNKAIEEIKSWKTQEFFVKRIAELRKTELHNDDSVIIIIEVTNDSSPEINYSSIQLTDLEELIQSEAKGELGKPDVQENNINTSVSDDQLFSSKNINLNEDISNDDKSAPMVPFKRKRSLWETIERRIDEVVEFLGFKKKNEMISEEDEGQLGKAKDQNDAVLDVDKDKLDSKLDVEIGDDKKDKDDDDISSISEKF